MKIIPLSEGTFTIDKTKHFIPFDAAKDDLQSRSVGSLLVEIQPFVVITSKDILLLDTGLGFNNKEGRLQIHQNLSEAGISPNDITKVLMTHLHKDHAGAASEPGNRQALSFPDAIYYIQERELSFAFEKGSPSFMPEELEVLRTADKIQLLTADTGTIDEYISFKVTGAHSPYHQVFWIKEGNEVIFFGGDDAPQLQQMKHRFVAKYDFDGKKAMELRREWWQTGEQERWNFLFYHDVKHPTFQRG
jgi:glyoxylase-like metal-dependent hydrolase (beta-lactamase superfamily II)